MAMMEVWADCSICGMVKLGKADEKDSKKINALGQDHIDKVHNGNGSIN